MWSRTRRIVKEVEQKRMGLLLGFRYNVTTGDFKHYSKRFPFNYIHSELDIKFHSHGHTVCAIYRLYLVDVKIMLDCAERNSL